MAVSEITDLELSYLFLAEYVQMPKGVQTSLGSYCSKDIRDPKLQEIIVTFAALAESHGRKTDHSRKVRAYCFSAISDYVKADPDKKTKGINVATIIKRESKLDLNTKTICKLVRAGRLLEKYREILWKKTAYSIDKLDVLYGIPDQFLAPLLEKGFVEPQDFPSGANWTEGTVKLTTNLKTLRRIRDAFNGKQDKPKTRAPVRLDFLLLALAKTLMRISGKVSKVGMYKRLENPMKRLADDIQKTLTGHV